jgi:hypothetical protein
MLNAINSATRAALCCHPVQRNAATFQREVGHKAAAGNNFGTLALKCKSN